MYSLPALLIAAMLFALSYLIVSVVLWQPNITKWRMSALLGAFLALMILTTVTTCSLDNSIETAVAARATKEAS